MTVYIDMGTVSNFGLTTPNKETCMSIDKELELLREKHLQEKMNSHENYVSLEKSTPTHEESILMFEDIKHHFETLDDIDPGDVVIKNTFAKIYDGSIQIIYECDLGDTQ